MRDWPAIAIVGAGMGGLATAAALRFGWHDRNVTLLGDACHPMTPYMAQGAAMALEDAAVLARLLDGVADQASLGDAFRRFEATRQGRTSRVQLTSRTNTWLRGRTDVDWVYSYNPWTAPLAA